PSPCRSSASFNLEPDRPDMPCVPDLTVVEGGNPHEHAARNRNVVRTMGVEATGHLQRPVSGGPARRTSDVGAVTGEIAADDDAGNDHADRNARIVIG